jgi:hypothetical protein
MEKPKPLLRKEDIVQSTITINVTRKHTTSADITSLKLKVNLQEWIKMTPDEQDAFCSSKLDEGEEYVTHNVLG